MEENGAPNSLHILKTILHTLLCKILYLEFTTHAGEDILPAPGNLVAVLIADRNVKLMWENVEGAAVCNAL